MSQRPLPTLNPPAALSVTAPAISLRNDRPWLIGIAGTLLAALAAFVPGCKWIQSSAYLPLHMAMESFAILVSLTIFILIWIGHRDRKASDIVLGCLR